MERLKRLLTALLSLALLLNTKATSLQIRPSACYNSAGDLGTCMFVWECIKTEGKHLGTCADGFLFGSCCEHNDSKNNLFPQIETTTRISTNSATSSNFPLHSELINDLVSTIKPRPSVHISTLSPVTSGTLTSKSKPPSIPTILPPILEKPFSIPNQPSKQTTNKPQTELSTQLSTLSQPMPSIQTKPTKPSSHTKPNVQTKPTSATKPSSLIKPIYIANSANQTTPVNVSKPTNQAKPIHAVKPTSSTRPSSATKPSNQSNLSSSQTKPSIALTHSSYKPTFRPTLKQKPTTSSATSSTTQLESKSPLTTIENVPTLKTTSPHTTNTMEPYSLTGSLSSSHQYSTYPGGWFRPTGFTTKRPQRPTKPSNSQRPHRPTKPSNSQRPQRPTKPSNSQRPQRPTKPFNTQRPQAPNKPSFHPYTRPTWKPRPTSSGYSTTPKPHVFTFASYYTTKPPTTKFPSTSANRLNVTETSLMNLTTTHILPVKKPTVTTTVKPTHFDASSIKDFNVTMIPFFTTFRPEVQTGSTTISQFLWFPTSNTPSSTNSDKYNTTVISGSVLVESTTPSYSKTTIRPTLRPTGEAWTVKPTIEQNGFSSTTTTKKPFKQVTSGCGQQNPHPQKKVVGGTNSAFGSWPWQASVRRTSFFGFSSTHRCGGALVSRQWVATAGHCVDDLLLSQIKIRVGEYDFASIQEPHGYVERGVIKKVVHPRYNFFTYENDLALVQLDDAIDAVHFPHVAPICLPPSEENLVGKNATVTGWGRLSEGGVLPSILQEVQVPIISNEKCKTMFLAAGRHEYIPEIFMCAGFEEGGRDSCQGDSGGPLQIQAEEGYWFLAGIISWGIGCAEPNMPGVCTRISKFKDWIVQHIGA